MGVLRFFFPSEYSPYFELTHQITTDTIICILTRQGLRILNIPLISYFSSSFSKELLVRNCRNSRSFLLERIWICISLLGDGIHFPFADTKSAKRKRQLPTPALTHLLQKDILDSSRRTFWIAEKEYFGLLQINVLDFWRRSFWTAVEGHFGLLKKNILDFWRRAFLDCWRRTFWIGVEGHFGLQKSKIFWIASGRRSGAWDPVSASHSSKSILAHSLYNSSSPWGMLYPLHEIFWRSQDFLLPLQKPDNKYVVCYYY